MTEWRKIATIPPDVDKADLWTVFAGEGCRVPDCRKRDGLWEYVDPDGLMVVIEDHEITHWMPVPAPPTPEDDK